ncbi:hypothetical protein PIB30_021499 [Stylosanthes scabra]|uniref:Uncharacterized protein n=1 Tax=Stylosanthes scabra TaxID=79078 RepID=A0ABU6Z972_9FABA|nr:hypothetical protein [Stylosanthes scabra]
MQQTCCCCLLELAQALVCFGAGVNRPPPIQEMEEPETQVQLDPHGNVPEAGNQLHTPNIQTEQSSAAGKGDSGDINFPNQASNEGRSTYHQDRSGRTQGENQIGSFSNSSVPEVGGKIGELPIEFNTQHQSYSDYQGHAATNLVADKEDDPNKRMPIKELLKQAFREEMCKMVNLNATKKWSYRDNPNSDKKGKSKKEKKLKQCTSEDPYVVEFPDEDEEMLDLSPNQNKYGMSDEELA